MHGVVGIHKTSDIWETIFSLYVIKNIGKWTNHGKRRHVKTDLSGWKLWSVDKWNVKAMLLYWC
jgi:hypothetical protein